MSVNLNKLFVSSILEKSKEALKEGLELVAEKILLMRSVLKKIYGILSF